MTVRVLGLDHGAARCGLAVSDAAATLATPLDVIEKPDSPGGLQAIAGRARDLGAGLIVVGLPLLADGTEGRQARVARSFAGRLRALVDCGVELHDERFTSRMADASGAGQTQAAQDAVAAAHMLQGFLDARGAEIRSNEGL